MENIEESKEEIDEEVEEFNEDLYLKDEKFIDEDRSHDSDYTEEDYFEMKNNQYLEKFSGHRNEFYVESDLVFFREAKNREYWEKHFKYTEDESDIDDWHERFPTPQSEDS